MKSIITDKRCWMLCCALLLGLHVSGYAQHTVSGTVTDANTSETIPGVNIRVQGTSIGTISNADGSYELTAETDSDTLIFSYVGYQTQTLGINGRSEINLTLQEQTFTGEELVVVGYGTQRAEDITSAVSSVSSDEFTESSSTDAASLIKGKVAGLSITNPSGDPTAGSNIRLRGTTSLNASGNPLVLVDGVPGSLNTVPPQNIKSISVLKGGSAAAMYGSRGSNGVILIETKNNVDGRTSIAYSGYLNMQNLKNPPDLLTGSEVRKWREEYPTNSLEDYGYNTDWIDVVTRRAISQNHNLSFSGGDNQTNYTLSANYKNAEGIFLNSDNEDLIGQINIRHSMFENKLQANVDIIAESQEYSMWGNGWDINTIWNRALSRNPTDRPRDDEGNYVYRGGTNYDNPLVLLEEADGKVEERKLRMNGTITFNPIQNLSLKLLGSTSQWSQTHGYAETFKHITSVKMGQNAFASRGAGTFQDNLLEFTGTYQDNFNAHSVNLLGGYSYQQVLNEDFFMQNWDFPTDVYSYDRMESGNALSNGKAVQNSNESAFKLISFFSRFNYNFDNRYLLMGSIRYEGNSKFGTDNKWGIFPAVSAGWRISNETFMDNPNFISNLKLRIGFGVTGIAPSTPYTSLSSLNFGAKIFNNGQWVQGISPARNANPNLRWERKEEINLGLDFGLFNDRLNGSFDIYRRTTKDLLHNYEVSVPPNVYPTILANVGEMRNEGLEAEINYRITDSQAFSWNSNVTFSTNRNKLMSLSNNKFQSTNDYFYEGNTTGQLPTHRIEVGESIGNFYGYKSVDIDEGGKWIVLNEEGERIKLANADLSDRHVLGNGIPKYNLGWNNTFRYKNFDLAINMRGAFGFQILNGLRMNAGSPLYFSIQNVLQSSFDKAYGKQVVNSANAYVSYYVEDGDYWKLDNLTFGYTFDAGFIKKYVRNARLYITGKNLLTITGYQGMDPEVDIAGLTPGFDQSGKFNGKYPSTRTLTVGVNLSF